MTIQDATALLDLRTALLDEGPSPALEEATEKLKVRLAAAEPLVRRITAEETGASDGAGADLLEDDLLERLAAGESVHPVRDAQDLADRLDDDRRCYVLEHPALPGRPMNVVWVALWDGIAGDISAILDPTAPTGDAAVADTAVFYSIWSAEPGLVGLPGGFQLLSGAIDALRAELPRLENFVTLSPVPGFRSWWEARHGEGPEPDPDDSLLAECARYLTTFDERGRPLDPVARFHLGNGARLLALRPRGDRSERGMQRSFGIMANYRYEPEDHEANRAALSDARVALGEDIDRLLVGDRVQKS